MDVGKMIRQHQGIWLTFRSLKEILPASFAGFCLLKSGLVVLRGGVAGILAPRSDWRIVSMVGRQE